MRQRVRRWLVSGLVVVLLGGTRLGGEALARRSTTDSVPSLRVRASVSVQYRDDVLGLAPYSALLRLEFVNDGARPVVIDLMNKGEMVLSERCHLLVCRDGQNIGGVLRTVPSSSLGDLHEALVLRPNEAMSTSTYLTGLWPGTYDLTGLIFLPVRSEATCVTRSICIPLEHLRFNAGRSGSEK